MPATPVPATEAANTDAFVEVDEITLQGEVKRIFSGWMFAASPGLHGVEHPIYDIWLTDCKGTDTTVVSAQPDRAEAAPPPPPPAKNVRRRSRPPASAAAIAAAADAAAAAAAAPRAAASAACSPLSGSTARPPLPGVPASGPANVVRSAALGDDPSASVPLSGGSSRQLAKIRFALDRLVEQRACSAAAGFRSPRSCADARSHIACRATQSRRRSAAPPDAPAPPSRRRGRDETCSRRKRPGRG